MEMIKYFFLLIINLCCTSNNTVMGQQPNELSIYINSRLYDAIIKHDDSGWKLVKKSELPVRGKWIIDTEGLLISITDGLLFPFNDGDEFFFWVSPIPETILNKIFTY